jgi:hypothetical protein
LLLRSISVVGVLSIIIRNNGSLVKCIPKFWQQVAPTSDGPTGTVPSCREAPTFQ